MTDQECLERLRIMHKEGASVLQLARDMGVAFKTVYNWINGTHEPTGVYSTLLRMFIEQSMERA